MSKPGRTTKKGIKGFSEAEQRFRAIFDNAFEFIGLLRPDGTLIEANETALSYIGAPAAEVIGRPFWETAWWKDSVPQQERLKAAIAEAAKGKFVRFEAGHTGRDGAVDIIDFSLRPATDDGGRVTYIIPEGRRITELRRAERASAILAAIVSSANDAIISLDSNAVIQTWNKGAERLFGWSAAEAIGQQITMLVPPVHLHEREEIFARLNRGEPVSAFDTVRQRKDGSLVDVSLAVSPVKKGDEVIGASAIIRDIRERKAAQAALTGSEERWRALLAAIPGMVFTTDAEGRTDFINDYFYHYTGLANGLGLGDGWVQALHPDDQERAQTSWIRSVRTGEPYENELRFRRHDGAYRWFSSRAVALREAAGRIVKWAGTSLDIEETKQTQLAQRASEERLQVALAAGGMGTWDRELRTSKSTWDDRMFEMCGFSPEPFVEVSMFEAHIHPDDLPGVKKAIDRTVQTGAEYRCDFRFLRPDGRIIWLHGRGGLRCDAKGIPTHIIGINFDITEHRQAEQKLHESEERFRLLAENIDQVFWFAELEPERVTYVSPAFEQLWEIPVEALYENPRLWVERIHPEDRIAVRQAFENWVGGWLDTYDTEYRILQQEGDVRWIHDRGIVIGFKDGRPCKLSGIATDITERKRVEEERKDADRRKDEFIATLAHELRNPLAPISNVISLLQLQESLDPNVRHARDVIGRQIDHLTRLIDDLLDVSRITRDRLELRKERVNLADIVNLAVESSHPLIDQHHHKLSILLPGEPIYFHADKPRLAQVIMNLLSNAAKYTPEGGRISLSAERNGEEVILRVKDNGVGIAPNQLSQIFDMFYQANRSYEQLHGGLGIGLTLVRRLVEMHGGHVEAHSEGLNQGSEFIVGLPIFVEQPSSRKEGRDVETTKATPRRILVVDDYGENAETLAELLRFEGHEVEIANDGLTAVEIAEKFRPAVVLLDIGMPKLNGYEAARKIRAQPWGIKMVLVAVTGWGGDHDRARSRTAGFDAHLLKPVNYAEVAKLIADLPSAKLTAT